MIKSSSYHSEDFIDLAILNICQYKYDFFLKKDNVIGVGLGYKVKNGAITNRKCIKVFVTKKVPSTALTKNSIIPLRYYGYETDVLETGIVRADGLLRTNGLYGRVRPVTGGYNIGPALFEDFSGTYGCMVRDESGIYILSCNHVIAGENEAPVGYPILQPASDEHGILPDDLIARLRRFIPLKFITSTETPENFVDCAIAQVFDLSLVSKNITFIGAPQGIMKPQLGLEVQKVGCESEKTIGNIWTIGTTMKIDYDNKKILFKNLIINSKMSGKGDSGSVLLNNDAKAIGLVIASSPIITVCNPIEDVLDALEVELII